MKFKQKIIATIYGILGSIFVLGGLVTFLLPEVSFPQGNGELDMIGDIAYQEIKSLVGTIKHLSMELGVSIVALGSILLWGSFNTSKSQKLDFLFIGYFTLFAGLHWYEFINGNRTISSPLINSIPLALFVLVLLLRRKDNS